MAKEKSVAFFSAPIITGTKIERERTAVDFNSNDFVPFGRDNLFPEAVESLNLKSPNHRGIMNRKVDFTVAGGFAVDGVNNPRLEEFIERANPNESLTEVYEKIQTDDYHGGNGWLELVRMRINGTPSIAFFHRDWTEVRYKKLKVEQNQIVATPSVLLHPRWARYLSTKNAGVELPIYPEFKEVNGVERSMFHFKSYESRFKLYGIPRWYAAVDAAGIAYKTNKWNFSRLENDFSSSAIVLVDADMTPTEAEDMESAFNKKMVGEGKQGQTFFIIKQMGGDGTKVEKMVQNSEGEWIKLHDQSSSDLIVAHDWFRTLSGLPTTTGFDLQRVRTEFELSKMVTRKPQNKFIKACRRILREQTVIDPTGLVIQNESPITILDKLTADAFTLVWEARKAAGLTFNADDPTQQITVSEANQGPASITING